MLLAIVGNPGLFDFWLRAFWSGRRFFKDTGRGFQSLCPCLTFFRTSSDPAFFRPFLQKPDRQRSGLFDLILLQARFLPRHFSDFRFLFMKKRILQKPCFPAAAGRLRFFACKPCRSDGSDVESGVLESGVFRKRLKPAVHHAGWFAACGSG